MPLFVDKSLKQLLPLGEGLKALNVTSQAHELLAINGGLLELAQDRLVLGVHFIFAFRPATVDRLNPVVRTSKSAFHSLHDLFELMAQFLQRLFGVAKDCAAWQVRKRIVREEGSINWQVLAEHLQRFAKDLGALGDRYQNPLFSNQEALVAELFLKPCISKALKCLLKPRKLGQSLHYLV